jgi:hypothetical protein
MRTRRHRVTVEILCDQPEGACQAANRVQEWLETFGHTDCSHGFEFLSVGVAPRKTSSDEHEQAAGVCLADAADTPPLRATKERS